MMERVKGGDEFSLDEKLDHAEWAVRRAREMLVTAVAERDALRVEKAVQSMTEVKAAGACRNVIRRKTTETKRDARLEAIKSNVAKDLIDNMDLHPIVALDAADTVAWRAFFAARARAEREGPGATEFYMTRSFLNQLGGGLKDDELNQDYVVTTTDVIAMIGADRGNFARMMKTDLDKLLEATGWHFEPGRGRRPGKFMLYLTWPRPARRTKPINCKTHHSVVAIAAAKASAMGRALPKLPGTGTTARVPSSSRDP